MRRNPLWQKIGRKGYSVLADVWEADRVYKYPISNENMKVYYGGQSHKFVNPALSFVYNDLVENKVRRRIRLKENSHKITPNDIVLYP